LRCYGNTRNAAWQSTAVIRQAHRTPHALRMPTKTPLVTDKIDAPVACATLSATTPFHFVHTAGGVVTRTRNVSEYMLVLTLCLVTFRVSRRPREMYCGHARQCVCLCVCRSAAACLHYCTDPDVTWRSGRGCPLVVHYLADLQSVHGLRCYGNTMKMRGREPSGNPPGLPHAARSAAHYACRRILTPLAGNTRRPASADRTARAANFRQDL